MMGGKTKKFMPLVEQMTYQTDVTIAFLYLPCSVKLNSTMDTQAVKQVKHFS